jgi:hypothetical protein
MPPDMERPGTAMCTGLVTITTAQIRCHEIKGCLDDNNS